MSFSAFGSRSALFPGSRRCLVSVGAVFLPLANFARSIFLGLLSAVAADRGCLLCCGLEASGERSFSGGLPARATAMERRTEREHVDWLQRRTRAMCVNARGGGRAAHEKQSIF